MGVFLSELKCNVGCRVIFGVFVWKVLVFETLMEFIFYRWRIDRRFVETDTLGESLRIGIAFLVVYL